MKICNKEAMKLIKELESKKNYLLSAEDRQSHVQYKDGETRPSNGYDYAKTRKKVAEIDAQIGKIKHALSKANCEIVVDEFNVTLGEALVMLAQYNSELSRLTYLANALQVTTSITPNGVTVFNECLYNVETAAKDAENLTAKINKLQVAIDRANLVNFYEI